MLQAGIKLPGGASLPGSQKYNMKTQCMKKR